MHFPHAQRPRPLQSKPLADWQVAVETGQLQLSPDQPSAHTHSLDTHAPRPAKKNQPTNQERKKGGTGRRQRRLFSKQTWIVPTLTSTQQPPTVRAGEVVHLAVFPIHCPQVGPITHTPPALTHSPTAAVHVSRVWSAVPVQASAGVRKFLIRPVSHLAARRLAVVVATPCRSTAAATFGVDPDHRGFVVTHRANKHFHIFIAAMIGTRSQAKGDLKVGLEEQRFHLQLCSKCKTFFISVLWLCNQMKRSLPNNFTLT